ncbi:MAG: DUF4861 domain-containing protein [Bacteroidaceae bacterium]|nr:DUF4861 domain-containing protein [Bacteroidaceae bacterium]
MKRFLSLLAIVLVCSTTTLCGQEVKPITISVNNNWNEAKKNEPIVIKLSDLNLKFRVQSAVVKEDSIEIPSQLDDMNGDLKFDELAFITNLPANGKKLFNIIFSSKESTKTYIPRVYAEMLVSSKDGKHVPVISVTIPGTSNIYSQMHHHGPALESELVAYRLYFDKRQTIDIYGKFHKGFEIKESQFYPTDPQLVRGFGDDVLFVGSSCGVGTLRGWDGKKTTYIDPVDTRTERIIAYGPVRVIAEIVDNGWQYQGTKLNMTTKYTLYAGHRDLFIDARFEEPLQNEIFATGVEDIKNSISYFDHKGLVGCWGRDWPVNDTIKYAKETVGLGTYIPQKYVVNETKDNANYLYTIGAKSQKTFHYYTVFTSRKETFGCKTPNEWFAYLRQWKKELEHPAMVKIKKIK